MKAPWLVGAVVLGHAVVFGVVIILQGCGTVQTGPVSSPEPPSMPGRPAGTSRPVPPVVAPPVQVPAPVQPIKTTPYTVVKGDTLSQIARRHNVSMAEIMALSGLRDADSIRVGQTLLLPGTVNVTAPASQAAPASPPPADGATVHVVRSGETLSHIAVRYKVSVAAIRQANALQGDRIMAGQSLTIPGASEQRAESAPAAKPVVPARALPRVEPERSAPQPEVPAARPEQPQDLAGPSATGYQTVEVTEGDTLRSIAMRHAVSLSELRALNGLPDTAEVVPGQTLRIPRFD